MKKAFSYLFIFIGLQLVGGAIITTLWSLIAGNSDKTAAMLITTTGVIGLLTIVIFLWTRYAEVSPTWLRTRPWTVLSWSVIAALGALIPSAWIQEQMPELPNIAEQEFGTIMGTPWGYLVIGLLAPLSEEIVLRGAILKELLKSEKLSTWTAIAYYRTGSILPGVAYHWANNSVAYVMYALYPDPDMKLIDIFKGSEQHVYMALGFSLLILLPALYQLHLWMRRAE